MSLRSCRRWRTAILALTLVSIGRSQTGVISDSFSNLDTTNRWEVVGGTWSVSSGFLTGTWSQSAAYTDQGNLLLRGLNLDLDYDATFVAALKTGETGFALYNSPGNKYNVNLASNSVNVEKRFNTPDGTPYIAVGGQNFPAVSTTALSTVKLSRRGAVFSVYVNDSKVFEFSDQTWSGRLRLGLKTYGTAVYDSFEYRPVTAAQADLALSSLVVSPTTLTTRAFSGCSFTVVNSGPTALNNTYVNIDYYLSANATFGDGDDVKIGDTGINVTVVSGASASIALSQTGLDNMARLWPASVAAGNYYVFAAVTILDSSPTDPATANNATRTQGTITYGPPLSISYSINPSSASYGANGGSGSVAVTVSGGAGSWTTFSDSSWLTTTSGSSGTGGGTVGYFVAANQSTSTRQGALTIAGRTFVVTQSGLPPVVTGDLRMANTSTRVQVGAGANVLITGVVLSGSGAKRYLVRAAGPALAGLGVPGVLADPMLTVFSGSTPIASNDNWDSSLASTFSSVGAFAFSGGSRDAALVVTLSAGNYTFQVSGAGGTSGVALVEVYELP